MDADNPGLPEIIDRPNAPIVFFDGAPTFAAYNGIVAVTLTVAVHQPAADGAQGRLAVAGYLRTNYLGARDLINALEKALLAVAPTENEAKN